MVVLGILIAFGLDAWWDRRGHARDVADALTSVRAEMALNRDQLVQWIAVQKKVRDAAQHFASVLRDVDDGAIVQVPDSLVAALFLTPSFDPASGALEALINSDAFGDIEDDELRVELASWTGYVRDAAEDEGRALALAQAELFPALGLEIDLTEIVSSAYDWALGDTTPDGFRVGSVRVRSTKRLINFAMLRSTYGQWAADELGDVLAHTELIIELIGAELEP